MKPPHSAEAADMPFTAAMPAMGLKSNTQAMVAPTAELTPSAASMPKRARRNFLIQKKGMFRGEST